MTEDATMNEGTAAGTAPIERLRAMVAALAGDEGQPKGLREEAASLLVRCDAEMAAARPAPPAADEVVVTFRSGRRIVPLGDDGRPAPSEGWWFARVVGCWMAFGDGADHGRAAA